MTQEEKAKAYDKLFVKAQQIYNKENDVLIIHTIEDLFPELAESDDEKIRKALLEMVHDTTGDELWVDYGVHKEDALAWLENQGEHANFRNNIQIGDKVTRNRDGVLVNLSQLNRVAKKDEKQGEQKSSDKIEPKFKVGDWAVSDLDKMTRYISEVHNDKYNNYYVIKGDVETECDINEYDRLHHLWTIQDAKDGDVLVASDKSLFIYDGSVNENGNVGFHISFTEDMNIILSSNDGCGWEEKDCCHPATKEQRDLLFRKMKESGYEWDAKKKELRKIEQKSAWSEEDARLLDNCISLIEDIDCTKEEQNWLKSLRPQSHWKPSDEQMVALQEAMNIVGILTITGSKINSLYQDLKKLKG